MNNTSKSPEIPLGLGMALAKNPLALESFARMTNEQKRSIIARTHGITSSREIESFVQSNFTQ